MAGDETRGQTDLFTRLVWEKTSAARLAVGPQRRLACPVKVLRDGSIMRDGEGQVAVVRGGRLHKVESFSCSLLCRWRGGMVVVVAVEVELARDV